MILRMPVASVSSSRIFGSDGGSEIPERDHLLICEYVLIEERLRVEVCRNAREQIICEHETAGTKHIGIGNLLCFGALCIDQHANIRAIGNLTLLAARWLARRSWRRT